MVSCHPNLEINYLPPWSPGYLLFLPSRSAPSLLDSFWLFTFPLIASTICISLAPAEQSPYYCVLKYSRRVTDKNKSVFGSQRRRKCWFRFNISLYCLETVQKIDLPLTVKRLWCWLWSPTYVAFYYWFTKYVAINKCIPKHSCGHLSLFSRKWH